MIIQLFTMFCDKHANEHVIVYTTFAYTTFLALKKN